MYQIRPIGIINVIQHEIVIKINQEYIKGLLHAELFSHMHLVYGDFASNQGMLVKHVIVKVNDMNLKKGEIHATFSRNMDTTNLKEAVLFDLKPYFPCEDRVKDFEKLHITNQKARIITTCDETCSEEKEEIQTYSVESCGQIHVFEGQTYLTLDKENVNTYKEQQVIRVFWWFHRFDRKNYRKTTQCQPPYENAPKVGIFASRSPVRANPIAMTTARILKVDEIHRRIYLNSLDCFDGTPCIAAVPYEAECDFFDDVEVAEWVRQWPSYWVEDQPVREEELENRSNSSGETEGVNELSLEAYLKQCSTQDDSLLIQKRKSVLAQQFVETNPSKQDGLSVIEAYENNLKGVSVNLPYHKMTAIVGVSGSGKSSLAFDTIYAECQRRFSDLVGTRELLPKPKMTRMTGVIPAVAISQQVIGKNTRSTVGTYSDLYDELRSMFATIGVRHCPNCGNIVYPMTIEQMLKVLPLNATIYSLNRECVQGKTLRECLEQAIRQGNGACYAKINESFVLLQTKQMCYHCNHMMFHLTPATFNYSDSESNCKRCHGHGRIVEISEATIVQDAKKSLYEDASLWYKGLREFAKHPSANWMRGEVLGLAQKWNVNLELPYEQLPEEFRMQLMNGTGAETVTFSYVNEKNGRNGSICRPAEGAIPAITRFYRENGDVAPINQLVKHKECPICHGERLGKEARLVTIRTTRYPEVAKMTFKELAIWCTKLCESLSEDDYAKVKNSIYSIVRVCDMANKLGIDYLSLDRDTVTLSGGEKKRLKLLSSLGTNISGILYILDEPTAGLHPKDYCQLKEVLHTILDRGNTILMVEHNAEMVKEADQIIEVGPGAGIHGGEIVEHGPIVSTLLEPAKRILPRKETLDLEHGLSFHQVSYNNLKNVSFTIPKHAITCIHGVSGSGKSSLMEGIIYQEVSKGTKEFKQVCYVDQQPIGKNQRSTPATYLKLMDEIRKLYARTEQAKQYGLNEAAFSYNSTVGQCDCCKGIGKVNPEFMSDVWIPCPVCQGSRYQKRILEVAYQGYTIADVLDFSIEKARDVFHEEKKICHVLDLLCEVSLGYLILGQSTTTLSGGEIQRLKLVNELMSQGKGDILYLFDEPTSGLSQKEIQALLYLFHRLVQENSTIIMIEHNQEMIENCDYQIELGPKAGDEGGKIISQGKVPQT